MTSEKVKEIKKALEFNANYEHYNKSGYIDGYKCKTVAYADILTYINELESENDTLHTNLCEWRKENQQLKDRIENQRMTKKGFRYEILPSTENSPRRVKDYNEYSTLYNRLAELEGKIENGTLVELPCKVGDNAVAIIDTLAYPNAIYNVKLKDLAYIVEDENGDVTFQHITRIFGTEAEAEKRLEELRNGK